MNKSIKVIKTNSENPDFVWLIEALDRGLWERYPELKSNYWGNNIIEFNPNVIVIYHGDQAVACGCFKKYDENAIEIKRMYVAPIARGAGLAKRILLELEVWAYELNYSVSVLETLHKQKEAISLYQNVGYVVVENYGPYVGLENSICMKKQIGRI